MAGRHRFVVDPAASGVVVEARSNMGPVSFATRDIRGWLEAAVSEGWIALDPAPSAELELDLRTLRSGNPLYDAELAQRLDVRRHPEARISLEAARRLDGRYRVAGAVSLHGETRTLEGSVAAEGDAGGGWRVTGEQVFDIRDFGISAPSVLMLRIFPDVKVHLVLQLAAED